MKNDFDFIKEKIDNSGVNAPDRMDESYILDHIADTRPRVVPVEAAAQPSIAAKKRRTGRITAIAAAVVAAAVLGTALTVHFTRNRASYPTAPSTVDGVASDISGLIRFGSYEEIHTAVKELRERTERNRGYSSYDLWAVNEEADAAPDAKGGELAPSPDHKTTDNSAADNSSDVKGHSETYKQVDGVDEGDIIKTDGRYIYVVDEEPGDDYVSRVSVFPATPGVTDPILSIIPGKNDDSPSSDATADEPTASVSSDPGRCSILDLYIHDDRMVILCRVGGYGYAAAREGGYYIGSAEAVTRAYVYDIADMDHVHLLDTFTQSGSYTSSRMIGDVLYLVTNDYELDAIPACGRGDAPEKLEADCVYSVVDPSVGSYLIVSAYHTVDSSAVTDSKAVLGLGSDVYCSRDNLYISASDYSGIYRTATLDYGVIGDSVITYGADEEVGNHAIPTPKTKIFKVSLHDGVNFSAYGEIEGYINNQYSFDEYNGYLRVASTSSNARYEEVNNLYVLDGSLNVVGSVTGFAATESIKAVRYVGETAYVITYEQTDPLFVIDLSSPTAPAILGEVKISGFSTMLVPIDADTVLGLGVNTGEYDYTDLEVQDGFKLALFDVSDKSAPKVLDSKSFVNYSSEVMYNPKALVYNPDRDDYIIPLNYYYFDNDKIDYPDDGVTGDDDYEAHAEQYGAVLNFRIEDGGIKVTELHITPRYDVNRCVYVGDTVYAVSFDYLYGGAAHITTFSYR